MVQDVLKSTVESAKAGDEAAFNRLVEDLYTMVYGVAYGTVKDSGAAEDIAQEVFLSAWTGLGRLRRTGAFPAWLRMIARNLALNWIRSASYRRALAERQTRENVASSSGTDDVSEGVDRRERVELVRKGLDALNPKLREAIVLFHLEGHSIKDVASSLGLSEAAIKTRLHKGRRVLRAQVEAEWEGRLREELAPVTARPVQSRIASYMAMGPVMPIASQAGAGSGLGLSFHQLSHEGFSSFLNLAFSGVFIMSTKKLGLAIVVMLLTLAGILGGWKTLTDRMERGDAQEAALRGDEDGSEALGRSDGEGTGLAGLSGEDATGDEQLSDEEESAEELEDEEVPEESDTLINFASEEEEHGKIEDPEEYVSISGSVVDLKGNILPGALVMAQAGGYSLSDVGDDAFPLMNALRDSRHHFTAVTDVSGAYSIEGIQYEGTVVVLASHPGFSNRDGSEVVLDVEPGDSHEGIDIALVPGVTAFGRVISPAGLPVDDGIVSMLGWTTGDSTSSGEMVVAYTDAEGRFIVSLNRVAMATLLVRSTKFGVTSFPDIPIEDGPEIELRMRDTASLLSSVRWADGSPAMGVEISLSAWIDLNGSLRHGATDRGRADVEGAHEFLSMDPGMFYRVELLGAQRQALSPRIDIGRLQPGEAGSWEYVIEKPIVVYGSVFGETTGKPIRDVDVDIFSTAASFGSADNLRNRKVRVDSNGQYELNVLSGPGEYVVYPTHTWGTRDRNVRDYGKTIALAAGEERELNLTLSDTFTMSIQLVDLDGNPVVGAQAGVDEGGGSNSISSMQTDADGRFTWGAFRAGVEGGISIYAQRKRRASSSRVIGQPGEIVPEEILVLHEFGGIEGRVIDGAGNPILNTRLEILVAYGNDKSKIIRQTTDELGEFVALDNVPATEVYIDIRIAGAEESEAATWQSELMVIPADQVVSLGALSFETQPAAPQKKSMIAMESR